MSRNIKFKHAQDGKISVLPAKTSFSHLLTIGALKLTSIPKYDPDGSSAYKEYQTDLKGLEDLASIVDNALVWFSRTITALSIVMVYVDKDETRNENDDMFWLLAALGGLSQDLTAERTEIAKSIDKLKSLTQP